MVIFLFFVPFKFWLLGGTFEVASGFYCLPASILLVSKFGFEPEFLTITLRELFVADS